MTTLLDLLTRYAYIGQERQERLGEWVGNGAFSMDLPGQRISWAGGPSARCDLLGSEADGTWLWAWANRHLDLGEDALAAATDLRRRGEELGVAELVEAGFPTDDLRNGHALGMVATGLLDTDGYYFGHGSGTAVLTLVTAAELALPPADAVWLAGVVMRALGVFPVRHTDAARAYLDQRGAEVTVAGDGRWVVEAPAGGRLMLTFDSADRVTKAEVEQSGQAAGPSNAAGSPKRRPWRRR